MEISGTKDNSPSLLETVRAVRTSHSRGTELDHIHNECLVALRGVTQLVNPSHSLSFVLQFLGDLQEHGVNVDGRLLLFLGLFSLFK